MRILIAEDDQVLADGLLRTLRTSGAAVDHVASGTEADAALLANTEFDLLILDLGLPRLHGLEVLKHIRGDEKLKHLPVVILSSSREESDLARSWDLGVNAYVVKPVDIDQFFQAVKTLGTFWAVINETPVGD